MFVITSGNDSAHMKGSRHFSDEAIDVRTKTFTSAYKRTLRKRFEDALGPQFRVLLEGEGTTNEHMHAQVKKGTVFHG